MSESKPLDTGKALLASMFRQIVQFKMRDDMTGGGGYSGSPGGGQGLTLVHFRLDLSCFGQTSSCTLV